MKTLNRALPAALIKAINANFPKETQRIRATNELEYQLSRRQFLGIPPEEFDHISKRHFDGRLGRRYIDIHLDLVKAGILEVDTQGGKYAAGYYLPGAKASGNIRKAKSPKGICKAYRINPALIDGDPVTVQIKEKTRKAFANDYITRETVKILASLRIDVDRRKLESHVKQVVTAEYLIKKNHVKFNEGIRKDTYLAYEYMTGKGGGMEIRAKDHHQPLSKLIASAKKSGRDVIQYGQKIYIADRKRFFRHKLSITRTSYLNQLLKLKDIRNRANITCSRSEDINGRMNTSVTQCPNILLQLLKLDGEQLASIDLKNSQFTLLLHVLEEVGEYILSLDAENILKNKKCDAANAKGVLPEEKRKKGVRGFMQEEELETFVGYLVTHVTDINTWLSKIKAVKKLTKSGEFYEKFSTILQNEGWRFVGDPRDEAKRIMFATAFAKEGHHSPAKAILRKHFPELVGAMDGFKKGMVAWHEDEMSRARMGMMIEEAEQAAINDKSATADLLAIKNAAKDTGNAALAVMLQRIESRIFIDAILEALLRMGYRCLTKHDSVLPKVSDLVEVEAVVRGILDAILGAGEYTLKVKKGVEEDEGPEKHANPFSAPTSDDFSQPDKLHRPTEENATAGKSDGQFSTIELENYHDSTNNLCREVPGRLRRGFFPLDDGKDRRRHFQHLDAGCRLHHEDTQRRFTVCRDQAPQLHPEASPGTHYEDH